MNYHYIIILAIIAVIVIIQFSTFIGTKRKIKDFLSVFPKKSDEYKLQKEILIEKIKSTSDEVLTTMFQDEGLNIIKYYYFETNIEGERVHVFSREKAENDFIKHISNTETGISISHKNNTLKTIVNAINDYLKNNKTVSDFHLLKDIVDRNCDAKEEEINTQIPVPLYMGLVGTMAGILIGVGILAFGGGLEALLKSIPPDWFKETFFMFSEEAIKDAWSEKGSDGVNALMGGVSIAMISSILGIILTTIASNGFKNAKSQVESGKHAFLSWIQAKLLPTLSDNVVGAIHEMTGNLENFNKEFSDNTSNLSEALAKVNESYKLQTQLIDAVNKIQEGRTASTNLALLSKLIESSEQIGQLAEYLHNTNDYLANVRALNEKLDLHEKRTQVIEEVGKFFKTELEQIEARKGAIALTVGKVDEFLQHAMETLKEHTVSSLQELQKSSIKQQDILQQKTEEINKIVAELAKLSDVKKAITGFESAIKGQNATINRLAENIEKLANVKSSSGVTTIRQKTSIWQITLLGIIALSCIVLAAKSLI